MTEFESVDVLTKALGALDERLNQQGFKELELKIVGGFALIVQGIRDTGFTQDIDSMTKEFSPEVKSIIAKIGKELGIKLGWLNADMVLDDPEIIQGIIGEVTFERYGDFKVLKASIADLPTLLRLKIIAAGDNLEITQDEIEFERHFADVKALVRALNINSQTQLVAIAPNIADYPELQTRLSPMLL